MADPVESETVRAINKRAERIQQLTDEVGRETDAMMAEFHASPEMQRLQYEINWRVYVIIFGIGSTVLAIAVWSIWKQLS